MKSLCLHRINKDLKEINNSPLEGIGIVSLNNNPFKYVVNTRIMSGIFEGYCLQMLLTFPEQYPIKPPKILIYPEQYLDNTYHHHIFKSDLKDDQGRHFNKFCFDLLENDFLSTSSEENTGWNPSYTISTLLLQVQIFLSKPDFPNGYIPEKEKIIQLMKSMDTYEKTFLINNDKSEEIVIKHTWKNPYPEMFFKNKDNFNKEEINKISELKEIKENLTCFISRLNYIDDKNIILGYPIKKDKKGDFIPIPEILSYECFIEETSQFNINNENEQQTFRSINNNSNNNTNNNTTDNNIIIIDEPFYTSNLYSNNFFYNRPLIIGVSGTSLRSIRSILLNSILGLNNDSLNNINSFKSANNEFYDSWFPIYINDEHFEKNKTTILNYFSIIKYGNHGLKKYDFHPQYIFEVLPNILSEMIKIMTEKNISSSVLRCFFQYVLMFKKLEKKYNNIFIKYQKFYLEKNYNKLLKSEEEIDIMKEILELLILFLYSDNELNPEIKKEFETYIKKFNNLILLNLFDNKNNYTFINKDLLIRDLKLYNLIK